MMISAAPEEPLAPIWTVVAAAVPATITLVGTLAKLNAQRPLQTNPVRIDDPSPRLLRLVVHRPEWSIQPRFAVQMIVWHIAVAGALFLIWSKPEVVGLSSLSFLVPLAAIYAGAALYYAWALWKLRGVDLSARAGLVVESDPASFERRLLASMESSRSKLILFRLEPASCVKIEAEIPGARAEICVEASNSEGELSGAPLQNATRRLAVAVTCAPTRGIDGILKARKYLDLIIEDLLKLPPSRDASQESLIGRGRSRSPSLDSISSPEGGDKVD